MRRSQIETTGIWRDTEWLAMHAVIFEENSLAGRVGCAFYWRHNVAFGKETKFACSFKLPFEPCVQGWQVHTFRMLDLDVPLRTN